jgi:hypothetical protein
MRNLDQHTVTESALERLAQCPNPRLKEVMSALIRHLHEFAREVKLTPAEWSGGSRRLAPIRFAVALSRGTPPQGLSAETESEAPSGSWRFASPRT